MEARVLESSIDEDRTVERAKHNETLIRLVNNYLIAYSELREFTGSPFAEPIYARDALTSLNLR